MRNHLINIKAVNRAALAQLPNLLSLWLPDGKVRNGEWIALNPTRADKRPGSFCINVDTGRWSDFATGDRGGDVVSLAAYLSGTSQIEAAKRLAAHLGARHD
ncbi:hypothetical protein ACFL12_00735 [Pseudomonadota bacterium]